MGLQCVRGGRIGRQSDQNLGRGGKVARLDVDLRGMDTRAGLLGLPGQGGLGQGLGRLELTLKNPDARQAQHGDRVVRLARQGRLQADLGLLNLPQ